MAFIRLDEHNNLRTWWPTDTTDGRMVGWLFRCGPEALGVAFVANRKINLHPRPPDHRSSFHLPSWLAVNRAGGLRLWPQSRAVWLHPPVQCTVDWRCRFLPRCYHCLRLRKNRLIQHHHHHRRRHQFRSMNVNCPMRHCNCHFRCLRFHCRHCHHCRRHRNTAVHRRNCNHRPRTGGSSCGREFQTF